MKCIGFCLNVTHAERPICEGSDIEEHPHVPRVVHGDADV